MNSRKKVMKWLSRVNDLEVEIKLLDAEIERYSNFIRAKGLPNPDVVTTNRSGISKPTEDAVLLREKHKQKLHDTYERLKTKEDEIEAIKTQVALIYKESDMKAEWYQAICYFYFDHMSLCEISKKVGYEVSTVKKHKEKGVDVLVEGYIIA